MNLLGGLLLFGGYVLVYAAVADHGRFATHPWLGLLADAYTGETVGRSSSSSSATPSGSSSSSPSVQRAAVVTHGAAGLGRVRGVPA